MSTLLIHDDIFLDHVTPLGHPERPDRMRAIDRVLQSERFFFLEREHARQGDLDHVRLAHPSAHVDWIEREQPDDGFKQIDDDTYLSPGTWAAVMKGIGASTQAVDEVMSGKVTNAFAAIRPPGHHAELDKAMGFCLFNNVAVAARYAQKTYGIDRVAIMDFDVHHGNGTQDIFYDDGSVMYASTHQDQIFPGTGHLNETGISNNIVNAPLAAGTGSAEFREAMDTLVLPALERFEPELVLISAGFDGHRRDPMANLNLSELDYAWATDQLCKIADKHAGRRVVSLLEGGYDLQGLANSVAAHVDRLMHA